MKQESVAGSVRILRYELLGCIPQLYPDWGNIGWQSKIITEGALIAANRVWPAGALMQGPQENKRAEVSAAYIPVRQAIEDVLHPDPRSNASAHKWSADHEEM